MAAVILGPQSTSLWIISPPDLKRLKDDLASNVTLKVQFKYVVSRVTNTEKIAGTVTGERSFDLKDDTPARLELLEMLNKSSSNETRSQLPFLFPKFLKVIFDSILMRCSCICPLQFYLSNFFSIFKRICI